MSRSIRILIVAVVALAAVGGYWKLALAPKRVEAAELETEGRRRAGAARPDAESDRDLQGCA